MPIVSFQYSKTSRTRGKATLRPISALFLLWAFGPRPLFSVLIFPNLVDVFRHRQTFLILNRLHLKSVFILSSEDETLLVSVDGGIGRCRRGYFGGGFGGNLYKCFAKRQPEKHLPSKVSENSVGLALAGAWKFPSLLYRAQWEETIAGSSTTVKHIAGFFSFSRNIFCRRLRFRENLRARQITVW